MKFGYSSLAIVGFAAGLAVLALNSSPLAGLSLFDSSDSAFA